MFNKSARNAWEWCTFYHTVLPKWTNRLGVVTRKIVPMYYLQHFVGVPARPLEASWTCPAALPSMLAGFNCASSFTVVFEGPPSH